MRSSWKYIPLIKKDCLVYLRSLYSKYYIDKNYLSNRKHIINFLNYRDSRVAYQGKSYVLIKPTFYHIGYKVGQFTKTRKPFYFRSKKKK